MINNERVTKFALIMMPIMLLLLFLAGCGQNEASVETSDTDEATEETTDAPQDNESAAVSAGDESSEPIRIENNDGPPFYARFGENETFSDGEHTAIVFYRPPDCIPADFNLNQFFHFPDENSPGAFGCAPPTTTSVETWANDPETDPAPLVSEMTGSGAVPIWFFAQSEIETALADGVVTIGELDDLPSQQVGTASTYEELLHPSQSNESPLIQFAATGTLEDGGNFSMDVSQGAPDVEDHITIDLPG